MSTSKLADYLFNRIKEAGVEYTFGIPGDFVLPHYAAQERLGLKTVVMCHEPGVGYAADAYARLKGLGVALVTYGAGGLNMVNAVGLAYAEESPLLVISGGPETRFRNQKPQLHHCVKTFDTQYKVFSEVTATHTILESPANAQLEIDRVFNATKKYSLPGYIEMPRDLVNQEVEIAQVAPNAVVGPTAALGQLSDEIVDKILTSKQPVLMVGVEVARFDLTKRAIRIAEVLQLPVVTSILGKSSFPESHPNFIGNYFGGFADQNVRTYVESSDCVICLGVILTEMETGGYTAKLAPENSIILNTAEMAVAHHSFSGIDLTSAIQALSNHPALTSSKHKLPSIKLEPIASATGNQPLTVGTIINHLNRILNDRFCVVADVGDCLYAGLSLKTDCFLAPGYYSSMGFGVPAGIGAQLADPARRPIILVGDGGFQMTGLEISTAVKMGLNPIVILFNNTSYAMLKFIDQQRNYYSLSSWDYVSLAKAVGATGARATTCDDFQEALKQACASKELFLIEAVLSKDDISPTLRRLTDHFGSKVRASIA